MTLSRPRVDRKAAALSAILLVVALVPRLLFWRFQWIVSVDGTTYIRLARYFLGGPFIDTQQPPGYPFLISLALRLVGGDGVLAARLVDLVCGAALPILLFLLARRLCGAWLAFAGGIVLALTPLAVRYSITTMSEAPYVLFVLLAALAAQHRHDIRAGAAAGLAFLVRPEGLVLAGALALSRGLRPRAWLLLALGFLAAGAVPALVFNHHASGRWTLTRKAVNIRGDDFWKNEVTPEEMATPVAESSAPERLRLYAGSIRRVYPGRLWAEVRNLAGAAGWPCVVAILPALALGPDRGVPAAGLAQSLAVPLFPGVPPAARLALPLLPFALILALLMVRRVNGWRRPRAPSVGEMEAAWAARLLALVLLAGWLLAAIPGYRALRQQEDGYHPELVDAGRALAAVVNPQTLVFDRKPYTAFYAGARFQTTPMGAYGETIDAVVAARGDYLVIDESVCEIFRPSLLPLVRDSATMLLDPRLELVYFDPSRRNRHVAIYHILQPGETAVPGPGTASLNQLVSRLPHDPTLHALHAELLWLNRRLDEAAREYEMALQADTKDTAALAGYAELLLSLGRDPRRALGLAEAAARTAPENADLRALVARARTAAGLR